MARGTIGTIRPTFSTISGWQRNAVTTRLAATPSHSSSSISRVSARDRSTKLPAAVSGSGWRRTSEPPTTGWSRTSRMRRQASRLTKFTYSASAAVHSQRGRSWVSSAPADYCAAARRSLSTSSGRTTASSDANANITPAPSRRSSARPLQSFGVSPIWCGIPG